MSQYEQVDHPAHYGGKDNPYEAIKVIEAWGLGFNLGNTVKYISRHGKKPGADIIRDLKSAAWYLNREIENLEKKNNNDNVVIKTKELTGTLKTTTEKFGEQVFGQTED